MGDFPTDFRHKNKIKIKIKLAALRLCVCVCLGSKAITKISIIKLIFFEIIFRKKNCQIFSITKLNRKPPIGSGADQAKF